MKKNKLSNFLKTGILLFGISIILWNCEKENSETILNNQNTISIEKVQKQFNSAYNENAFSKSLPTPNWIENKTFYNNQGNQYLEIPFQIIHQEDIEKGTSVSFDKLVATSINNKIELKIVHFFGIDIKNNIVDFNNISHTELYNFSGFVTEYDLNKNVLGIKQYNKGKDTKNEVFLKTKSKEENSILARANESTSEYTETTCTRGCWYWEYTDGSRENISCSPWSCRSRTYSVGGSRGGSGSNSNNTSYNTKKNSKCAPGYTRNVDGKCMIDEQIVNNLTNKCAKDTFTELENGIFEDHPLKPEVQVPVSNPLTLNFSESILKLFNDSNNTHLTIQNGNSGNSNAVTVGRTITIGDSYLANATQLSIARTIIHESVHAYMNGLYYSSDFQSLSFGQKLRKYAEDNGYTAINNTLHHNFMGQYIDAMAYSLYEWDKDYGTGGNLDWNYYKSMVYTGMFQVDPSGKIATEIDTFKELVPNANDRQAIADIILIENNGNNDAKGTKCN